jgi:hypothetical protein
MLIDRIIKLGEHPPRQPTELESFLLARLREAEVIFADNVAQYLYCETPQEDWNIARDFPNVAPPFPVMFIEHVVPRYSLSEKLGRVSLSSPLKKLGTLILSREIEMEDPEPRQILDGLLLMRPATVSDPTERLGISREARLLRAQISQYDSLPRDVEHAVMSWYGKIKKPAQELIEKEKIRWVSVAYPFLETYDAGIAFPKLSLSWLAKDDGKPALLDDKLEVAVMDEKLGEDLSADDTLKAQVLGNISALLNVPLLTLSFMHCKNVVLKTIAPSPKLNRARVKRGNPPLAVYKILEIHPVKRILEREGDIQHTGLKRALHICRGHFKDYTVGKGLFGKVHGVFWWDMALRGSREAGIILKDYDVHTRKGRILPDYTMAMHKEVAQ